MWFHMTVNNKYNLDYLIYKFIEFLHDWLGIINKCEIMWYDKWIT